ncbi:MAG TPA: CsgG/HfaB family protein [Candidatus Eremiobacteraceae bacterium]|nr:CsgG/HfaB family protein [Candidatus Eremiobacteraceae bacterium]
MALPCAAQTAPPPGHKPGQRPTGKPIPAAQAQHQPQYKGIWEPVNYTEDINLNSVYFVSAQTGWVSGGTGGAGGSILNTQDGGEHWNVQWGDPLHGTEDAPTNFFFLDATHGWARQGYDHLLHTTDGKTWAVSGSVGHYSWQYVFTSEKNGFYIGRGPEIHRTTDGGRTWKVVNQCAVKIQVDGLPRNVQCNWIKVHFPTPTTGYAVAEISTQSLVVVGKTSDGGATWVLTVVDLPLGAPSDVFFLDADTGYMRKGSATEGQLNKTTDGGATWTANATPQGDNLRFADPEVGWSLINGSNNGPCQVYFTTDGGQHWDSRGFKFPVAVNDFSLPRRDRAYVVGDHGMVYRYRVVPFEYTSAGALDAPAMPAYGGPILDHLQQMKAQVAALQAKLGAGSTSSRAPAARGEAKFLEVSYKPSVSYEASQDTGGFVQDTDTSSVPTSSFMQNCCNQQVQSMQSSFSSFTQQIPTFSGKFRNLNLILVGLNTALDLMRQAKQIRSAFVALKSASDAQSAMAALSALATNLDGTSQAINSGFPNISAGVMQSGASGTPPGGFQGGPGPGGGVYSTGAGTNSPGNQPPNPGGQPGAFPATQNNLAEAGGPLTIGMLPFIDNTGSGGQAMALALSRAVQGEMAHSTDLQGRVLELDSGTNPATIDANAAVAIGQAQNVRVILLGTVLEASSEQSTKNASGPTIGGFHIGGSANSVKASVTLQADLYSVSTGAKIDSIRVTGTNSQTKVGANVSTSLGDLSTGGAAFDNSPIGKALHGAVTQLVQKVAADEPKMTH